MIDFSVSNPPINKVIEYGYVPILVGLLSYPNSRIQFESAWCLTNISSGTSEETKGVAESGAISYLIAIIKDSGDPYIVNQAVWAIGNIIGEDTAFRDYMWSLDIMDILKYLKNPAILESEKDLNCAAWVVSNLCRGTPMLAISLLMI